MPDRDGTRYCYRCEDFRPVAEFESSSYDDWCISCSALRPPVAVAYDIRLLFCKSCVQLGLVKLPEEAIEFKTYNVYQGNLTNSFCSSCGVRIV